MKWFKDIPNYLHAKQLLIELMETEYKIHDHINDSSPLASVRYHEHEGYNDHYLLRSYIDAFIYKKVNKYMGLTFDQFIDRPRYEIEKIIAAINDVIAKEAAVGENAISDLTKANKALK